MELIVSQGRSVAKSLTAVQLKCALFLGCVLFSLIAEAQTTFTRLYESSPVSYHRSHAKLCKDLFTTQLPFELNETTYIFENGKMQPPIQVRTVVESRSEKLDQVTAKALSFWVSEHGYTPEQAAMLTQRDQNLDPRRTYYFHLESHGHPAIFRIFDASTQVLKGGTVWEDATLSNGLSPMEIHTPTFRFPERAWAEKDIHRPAYMWEIGLMNIDRHLDLGMPVALTQAARLLDLHYNDKEMDLLGKSTTLEKRNMMIYAQTRLNRVEVFRRYGFEPVLAVSSEGIIAPYEIAPNLIWISMKAEDFLKKHYDGRNFTHAKNAKVDFDKEAFESFQKQLHANLSRLEGMRLPIKSLADVQKAFLSIFTQYTYARTTVGRSDVRNNMIIDFFEQYLVLLNSIPEKYKHNNWNSMKILVRESMAQGDAYKALYVFSHSIDKAFGLTKPTVFDYGKIDSFLNVPATKLKLIVPTEPTLILDFTAK